MAKPRTFVSPWYLSVQKHFGFLRLRWRPVLKTDHALLTVQIINRSYEPQAFLHARVIWAPAALWCDPDDVLRGVFDVAGFAMHTILRIDL